MFVRFVPTALTWAVQPSIQKLVGSVAQDALTFLSDEALHTVSYGEEVLDLNNALDDLATEFSSSMIEPQLLQRAQEKSVALGEARRKRHADSVRPSLSRCPLFS